MNNNNNKNFNKVLTKSESPLTNTRSLNKIDTQQINIEALIKNGETKMFLNNLAKSMIEDVKEFSNQSVEIFNTINTGFAQECHLLLKNACNYDKYLLNS